MKRQTKNEFPETENQVLRIITPVSKKGDENMKIPNIFSKVSQLQFERLSSVSVTVIYFPLKNIK